MVKNLLLLLTIFTCTSLSAQVWSGGGDNTSWDDPDNWVGNAVPAGGANVTFPDGVTANITGTAPNAIRRVIFDTLTTVTLDLDLDFVIAGNPVHAINIKKDANVTFGGTTDMRTFNVAAGAGRNALLIGGEGCVVTISEQATMNVDTCQNAVRMTKDDAVFINNGTFNLVNYIETGISMLRGTVTNNGTISISTGTVSEEFESDGINVSDGVFNNNAGGTITVTEAFDDGVEVLGTFNNAGTISTLSREESTANNNGLVVGSTNSEGFMNNLTGGIITTDGGIGGSNRPLAIQASGNLNNAGNINVSGGNVGQAFLNSGILTNEACAHIDMIESRILNSNAGMITNNGLLTSTWTAAGINNGAVDGSAVNNAFYGYANGNSDFAGGGEGGTDNGQKTGMGIEVDAENSCTITDIGIDVAYTWYADAAGTIEAGTNDENGTLNINDDIFGEPGTLPLYTCFGEDVQLLVSNADSDCSVVSGIDFVQLTDVFTLMPNPAQSYTQIKFGNEYIANEKNVEVYNAIGQLVQTANLNGADSYILNTNNLAAGIYTVNLQTEKGMQIERLIIQK